MREIIFRVWDSGKEEYKVSTVIGASLFTGFKGRNGEQIFEGDLLKWVGASDVADGQGVVVFDEYSCDYYAKDDEGDYEEVRNVAYRAKVIKEDLRC